MSLNIQRYKDIAVLARAWYGTVSKRRNNILYLLYLLYPQLNQTLSGKMAVLPYYTPPKPDR